MLNAIVTKGLAYDPFSLTIGILSFLLGVGYYFLCRDNIFGPAFVSCYPGHLWGSFPSFIHVFSLSLLSWGTAIFSTIWKCVFFWLLINICLELGQLLNEPLLIFPEALNDYFVKGTYSHWDVGLCVFGGVCALSFINIFKGKSDEID